MMQIEKARESLQAAELCHEYKLHNSTANRAYYAMFQAAVVALQAAGVQTIKGQWSHSGLQAAFALELTRRRKLYPHTLAAMLRDGLEIRNEADYEETGISERKATYVLRWAREFLKQVEQEVNRGRRA